MIAFRRNGREKGSDCDRNDRFSQALREILRLPDERLRLAAYGGHLGAGRLCRNRDGRRRRSHHPQHLPHPREGGGEGLFRARPHAPLEGSGGRRRPAMFSSRSPAASRRPRATRSSAARRPSISSSARRTIIACPTSSRAPSATARSSIPSFRSTTNSTISPHRARARPARAASPPSSRCRKAATSSAPSASCPIRAARKSPGRSTRSWPRSSGWPMPACAKSR